MKKFRIENQILIVLAFFSISIGLWGNFRQLWMQSNNFSAFQISTLISIGTFISVIGIIVINKFISLNKLKKFTTYSIIIKFLNLSILYFINKTGVMLLISILVIIDIVMEYLIVTCIYPLIVNIIKNNKVYSKRQLTEYLFRDIGILIGGVLIGRNILGTVINYNNCLFIANIFLIISIILLFKIKIEGYEIKNEKTTHIFKYILSNKILIMYLIYIVLANLAMSTSLGLKMLTLTNYIHFSDVFATNYLLIIGLIADMIGILALKFFTPKNDYITITIKFALRLVSYIIAFLSNDTILTLVAITWSILISTAYEDVCDGPYVNMVENEYQLSFNNIKYIFRILGEAGGVFLCGIMYEIGLRYMFGLSAIFIFIQIIIAYKLIYMREQKNKLQNIKLNK